MLLYFYGGLKRTNATDISSNTRFWLRIWHFCLIFGTVFLPHLFTWHVLYRPTWGNIYNPVLIWMDDWQTLGAKTWRLMGENFLSLTGCLEICVVYKSPCVYFPSVVKWSWKKSKVQTTPRCISEYLICGFMRKACMDFLLAHIPVTGVTTGPWIVKPTGRNIKEQPLAAPTFSPAQKVHKI